VKEPRKVLSEFGLNLADTITVRVHDSTADMRYVVIPARPAGTDGWSADQLAQLVPRDSMIGTGLAKSPEAA
jgi:nitrile hydratase